MLDSSVMVVLSGGQDSTTCLLEARQDYKTVHAVAFDYGQRHRIELESARQVASLVGVESFEVIDVRGLLRGRSPLVSDEPLETYKDFDSMAATIGDRVELTFVPLRNPFFLLVAANRALARDCYRLMTGVCATDNANYPDCTPQFVFRMETMLNQSLGLPLENNGARSIRILAPLLYLTKADTVRLALEHGDLGRMALALSHTCYAGERPPCGVCHSCLLRAAGFAEAGADDPLLDPEMRLRAAAAANR